jgi:uncharacterized protein HemX
MPKEKGTESKALTNKEKQTSEETNPASSKSNKKNDVGTIALAAIGAATLISLAAAVTLHEVGQRERKKKALDEKPANNPNSFFETDVMKNIAAGAKKLTTESRALSKKL